MIKEMPSGPPPIPHRRRQEVQNTPPVEGAQEQEERLRAKFKELQATRGALVFDVAQTTDAQEPPAELSPGIAELIANLEKRFKVADETKNQQEAAAQQRAKDLGLDTVLPAQSVSDLPPSAIVETGEAVDEPLPAESRMVDERDLVRGRRVLQAMENGRPEPRARESDTEIVVARSARFKKERESLSLEEKNARALNPAGRPDFLDELGPETYPEGRRGRTSAPEVSTTKENTNPADRFPRVTDEDGQLPERKVHRGARRVSRAAHRASVRARVKVRDAMAGTASAKETIGAKVPQWMKDDASVLRNEARDMIARRKEKRSIQKNSSTAEVATAAVQEENVPAEEVAAKAARAEMVRAELRNLGVTTLEECIAWATVGFEKDDASHAKWAEAAERLWNGEVDESGRGYITSLQDRITYQRK